jgi:hypothetical protein
MFLIRDLVSPRTCLAFTHHLAGWVVGVVFFLIVAFGIAIGLGSLPLALAGLPVLGLTLRCAGWLAAEERARFAVLLGVRIPAWPADPRRGYRWLLVPRRATLTGRQTWGTSAVGYGLLEVVVATVNLVLCLVMWAIGLVMVTLPLHSGLLPGRSATIGGTALRGPLWLTASVVEAGRWCCWPRRRLTRGLAVADAAFAGGCSRRHACRPCQDSSAAGNGWWTRLRAERRGIRTRPARRRAAAAESRWRWSSGGRGRSSPTASTPPGTSWTGRTPRPRPR